MKDFFYDLLPAVYRELDQAEGSPLRALLHVMDEEHARLLAETDQMYSGWFAETCTQDQLQAIASLLTESSLPMRRAFVANTIAARRRKGTLAALEHRISDACGWPALAMLRTDGKHAQHTLEAYVWRQTAYLVEHVTPYRLKAGHYFFHPMGIETPLFHVPVPQYDMERRMTLENMPLRLYRNAPRELRTPLAVEIPGKCSHPLPIEFRDLSRWEIPQPTQQAHARSHHTLYAAVDPILGRLMIVEPSITAGDESHHYPESPDLRVTFAYGFTTDIGGGTYPRAMPTPPKDSWVAYIQQDAPTQLATKNIFPSLMHALEAFRASPCCGTIVFTGSGTHDLPPELIDTTQWICPESMDGQRTLELRGMEDEVPCLRGHLRINAGGLGLKLKLNGLWIDGLVEIGGAIHLQLHHSTIRPTNGESASRHGIRAMPGHHQALQVELASSICGPILLPSDCMGITAKESILESIAVGHDDEHLHPREHHSSSPHPHNGFHAVLEHSTVLHAATGASIENHESIVGAESGSIRFFASTRYGDPGYARLRDDAPAEFLRGASDGSQLGAFHSMDEALRREQAKAALEESTPANLPSKLIFIPDYRGERLSNAQTDDAQTTLK